MAVYMISYDLHAPTQNRTYVEQDIESIGPWCKYLTTTYLVSSSLPLNNVVTIAGKHFDINDKMICSQVTKPISGYLTAEQWNWINTNL